MSARQYRTRPPLQSQFGRDSGYIFAVSCALTGARSCSSPRTSSAAQVMFLVGLSQRPTRHFVWGEAPRWSSPARRPARPAPVRARVARCPNACPLARAVRPRSALWRFRSRCSRAVPCWRGARLQSRVFVEPRYPAHPSARNRHEAGSGRIRHWPHYFTGFGFGNAQRLLMQRSCELQQSVATAQVSSSLEHAFLGGGTHCITGPLPS